MGKKKKRAVIWTGLLAALLLAWLLLSNTIIGCLFGQSLPKKTTAEWKNSDGTAVCAIDDIIYLGGIFQNVHIRGWTFVETEYDNSDREITLVLRNNDHTYSIPLSFGKDVRNDAVAAHPDLKIYSADVGFFAEFPTYNIRDGVYDIYVYCWENEHSYGLAKGGKQLVKNGSDLYMRSWMSAEVSPQKTPTEQTAEEQEPRFAVDSAAVNDNLLQIRGWAFEPGYDANGQKVYVALTDKDGMTKQYTTIKLSRPDVAKAYQNESCQDSGFQASIPVEAIPDGTWTLNLLVSQEEKVWITKSVQLVKNGTDLYKWSWVSAEVSPLKTPTEQTAEEQEPRFSVDSAAVNDNLIQIRGWAFEPGYDANGQEVYVALTGEDGLTKQYTTKKLSRPDVAKAYQNESCQDSGFQALIPVEEIPDGTWTLNLLVSQEEKVYMTKSVQIIKEGTAVELRK